MRQADLEDCLKTYRWTQSYLDNTNGRERLQDYMHYVAKVSFLKNALPTVVGVKNIDHDDGDMDTFKALENLSQCYSFFLKPLLTDTTCKSEIFTKNNVVEMHKRIGAHFLFEKPGHIRKCWMDIVPGETRLAPCLVEKGIDSLLATTKERLEACGHALSGVALATELIKIAATFLIQFSYIEPFEEGNDTVLKFLMAYIFNQFTMVPILLDMPDNKHVSQFDKGAVEDHLLASLQKTNALVADVFGNQLTSAPSVGELWIED